MEGGAIAPPLLTINCIDADIRPISIIEVVSYVFMSLTLEQMFFTTPALAGQHTR